jgi:colanic acid/amylovoran biosynthesis protein
LATGWSHKYESLFRDYDCVDGLVEVTSSDSALYRKIDMITEDVSARALRTKLKERSQMLKQQSEEMWTLIFNTLT